MPETSTDKGEATPVTLGALNENSAAEALLSRWTDDTGKPVKDQPKAASEGTGETKTKEKETTPPETPEEPAETPSSEEATEESEEEAEKPAQKRYADDSDDVFVKVKVGEEEADVSVKELKRLWGQEAALTRRSQETAELRKKADGESAKAIAALQVMTKRAQEKAAPYKQIDFLVAAQHLSTEDLTTLRQEAQRVLDEEKFLSTELDGFMTHVQANQREQTKQQAQACIKSLKDEAGPHFIPDWSDKTYDELRAFGVSQGLDRNIVDQLVDPAAIKLLHMARQFTLGQSKVTTTTVNKTPKKIVKTTKVVAPPSPEDNTTKSRKAGEKLRRSGKVEDAAEVFLSRWNVQEGS